VADIFVSYTSSDRDWAFWIARELQALGHTPHIHEWEITSGGDIYAWMERRHDAAENVLCVISDEYLKARYSTLERNAALWQAAGKRPGFVLLVVVKPCKLPTLADHIRRCELYGIPEHAARDRFCDFMRRRDAPAIIAFPGEAFAVSNVPIRVPAHFLGREDSLSAIEAALGRYDGRVAITALHGLRGVGKTTLAAAYAERHRRDYRATWWIRAQTESRMRADLFSLGVRLKWVAADEKEEPALTAILERLRNEGVGILLIYDNAIDAEALRPYLPRGGAAHVLVTSNAHAWRGVATPVEIRLWPKDIAAEYLIARTGRTGERAAAEELSETLDGLPLAHEQAAAYCERLDISFAEYRRRFRAAPARLLDDARHAPAEYHDGLTVAKTFAIAIEEAAKLHRAAEPLIVHAALLAPEPIPLFLFADAHEKFAEPLRTSLAGDGIDEVVAALRAFALVDREVITDERDTTVITDAIRLHRLVREVAAARKDGKAIAQMRHALIAALAVVLPQDPWEDPKTWPRARSLDSIALALVSNESDLPQGTEALVAVVLSAVGAYRHGALADGNPARLLFERALAIRERLFGPQHSDTAEILINLSGVLLDMGDLEGARPLVERSLAIWEKVLGPEHPQTTWSLNSLARVLHAQGDLSGARQYYERALATREKMLGPEYPDTATSVSNLGSLLHDQGDLLGARQCYERALAVRERVLGHGHPDTAISISKLADMLQSEGDLAGADQHYRRALAINEKVLGPEHPFTVRSIGHLARLLQEQGNMAEAQALYQRAVAISARVLGPQHLDTSRIQSNFATMLLESDRAAEALPLAEAALATRDKALGRSHRSTRDSARVTADALAAAGRAAEATALREQYAICDANEKS
jgi:tetratricopeptide (TPR) repeat protein